MPTAREALAAHRNTFWNARECDRWSAKECQLIGQMAREEGKVPADSAHVVNAYADARYYLGVYEVDQFYA